MPGILGQFVLKGKPNVSYDSAGPVPLIGDMPQPPSASDFKRGFIGRVRTARQARFTQAEIAQLLDIPQDRYKQYETRSFLPYHLIPKFCLLCGISMSDLFLGEQSAKPLSAVNSRRKRPAA